MLKPLPLSPQESQGIEDLLKATEKRLANLRHRVDEIKQLLAKNKMVHDQLSATLLNDPSRHRQLASHPYLQALHEASTDYRLEE